MRGDFLWAPGSLMREDIMLEPGDVVEYANSKTGYTHIVESAKYDEEGVQRVKLKGAHTWYDATLFAKLEQPLTETKSAVHKPDHYQSSLGIQVIDIINEYFSDNYNLGNVLKYLLRADKKGKRQEDLEKALQYLTWEVERGRG